MIVAPSSSITEKVASAVRPTISVVAKTGTKIGNIARRNKQHSNSDSVVYEIPCGTCNKKYYGESGRGLATRLKEHKADLRHHRTSNALVIHAEHTDHLPNWAEASALHSGHSKLERRAIEAAYITAEENMNTSSGFFRLAKPAAKFILKCVNKG